MIFAVNRNMLTLERILLISGCLVLLISAFSCQSSHKGISLGPSEGGNPETIKFSGYTWKIKSSDEKVSPGPNYYSQSPQNVWLDKSGYLHLAMTSKAGRWYCAEVINQESLGYGRYTFTIQSPINSIKKNAVLGLFTWDSDSPPYHREIDIEFSRWGNDGAVSNSQYVVHPFDRTGNRERFNIADNIGETIHIIEWRKDGITFQSWQAEPRVLIHSWEYSKSSDYPEPGNENIRINFWLYQGIGLPDTQNHEIVIKSFQFTAI